MKTNGFIHGKTRNPSDLALYELPGPHLRGISYTPIYRDFKRIFVVTPISPLPPIFHAPYCVYIAFSAALISASSRLEAPYQNVHGGH